MKDINDIELKNGDVVDLHQTVNGQAIFVVLNIKPLDVRYGFDLNYVYEYDMQDLLAPNKFNGEVEYEIVGNILNFVHEFIYERKYENVGDLFTKDDMLKAYQYGQDDCGEFGTVLGFESWFTEKYPEFKQDDICQSKTELLDCIKNLMGMFDNPLARLRMKGELVDEARKIGRDILNSNNKN